MEKDQHNWVLSCMSAQGFCLFVAVIKGQNSEVTWANHALFEFNQRYGSTLLITKAVVTFWMIFPVASAAFVWEGGRDNQHKQIQNKLKSGQQKNTCYSSRPIWSQNEGDISLVIMVYTRFYLVLHFFALCLWNLHETFNTSFSNLICG